METIDDQIAQKTERNDRWGEALKSEAAQKPSAYEELRQVRARDEIDRLNRRMQSQDYLEAAIANTPEGGTLSPALVGTLNKTRGIEGVPGKPVNGQIMEGGWNTRTGGYGFVIARRNPDGSMGYRPYEISRKELYGMMRNRVGDGGFSQEMVDRMGGKLASEGYTQGMLDQLANGYTANRQAMQGQIDRANKSLASGGGRGYGLGGLGGLSFDQQKELAGDKYESFMLKNVMSMLEKDVKFNSLPSPEEKADYAKRFMSRFYGSQGGMRTGGSPGTDKPDAILGSTGEEVRKRKSIPGVPVRVDKPAATPAQTSQNDVTKDVVQVNQPAVSQDGKKSVQQEVATESPEKEKAEYDALAKEMEKIGINHSNSEEKFGSLTEEQKGKWKRYVDLGLKLDDRRTREHLGKIKDKAAGFMEKVGDVVGEAYANSPKTMD